MKYYLIPEKDLIGLLENQIKLDCLEIDGVDNWSWYLQSYNEIIKEYFPDKDEEELEDYSFKDCARECLKEYKSIEC